MVAADTYADVTFEGLEKMHGSLAPIAKSKHAMPGDIAHLKAIENEMKSRKFILYATDGTTKKVLARWRTAQECEAQMKNAGYESYISEGKHWEYKIEKTE